MRKPLLALRQRTTIRSMNLKQIFDVPLVKTRTFREITLSAEMRSITAVHTFACKIQSNRCRLKVSSITYKRRGRKVRMLAMGRF